jgi:hypothetical protein
VASPLGLTEGVRRSCIPTVLEAVTQPIHISMSITRIQSHLTSYFGTTTPENTSLPSQNSLNDSDHRNLHMHINRQLDSAVTKTPNRCLADHGGPRRNTADHSGPRRPRRTTTDHAEHGRPLRITQTTADHGGPLRTTQTTADHCGPRPTTQTTADHCGPRQTTADHSGPRRPLRTTADHGGPITEDRPRRTDHGGPRTMDHGQEAHPLISEIEVSPPDHGDSRAGRSFGILDLFFFGS